MSAEGAKADATAAVAKPVVRKRTESPGPKAKAKAALSGEADKGATDAEKPTEEKRVETEKEIFGLHRQVFIAVFVVPVLFAASILAAFFANLGTIVSVKVIQYWKLVSAPVEKFLTQNTDAILVVAALATLSPLVLVIAISCLRAAGDVSNFPPWQKAAFMLLIVTAIGTAVTLQQMIAWKKAWDKLTDPFEKVLTANADSIVAGAAIVCLSPLAVFAITSALKAIWGCRITIGVKPVEPVEESEAAK